MHPPFMYIAALAEDHFNDVISNSAAIITVIIAFHTVAWWVDPSGGWVDRWMDRG